MTEAGRRPVLLCELRVAGAVPRWEVQGWRERFGVIAGITGRGEGPSDFDLGLWTRRPVGEVMGRWWELRRAEPGFDAFLLGHQVHGTAVSRHEHARGWTILEGVDGHVTARPGAMLLVTVADCVPVYLVAAEGRAVALLHAGWRGTAAGILARGVEALARAADVAVEGIVMHCGVGICGECYEVGSEVLDACRMPHPGGGPWHLDLRARLAEEAAGLGVGEVTISTHCTAHERGAFFSHRASGGSDGRMVAYLGIPHPAMASRTD